MSIKFNLWLLHKEYDRHPRSWICLKGNGIKRLFNLLEEEIEKENNITREELARRISRIFNCTRTVIKTLLQGKKEFYPIPVILEMSKLCKNGKKYLPKISQKIEFLKVNSAKAKTVIALKTLRTDLAKILGAFMADGSLSYQVVIASKDNQKLNNLKAMLNKLNIKLSCGYSKVRKEYFIVFYPNYKNFNKIENVIKLLSKKFQVQTHTQIEVSDEYKDSVEAFNRWVKNCFGIEPSLFRRRKNAWRTIFSNKIFGRYLICFFGIRPGYKTDRAWEPEIIKNSSIYIRKAFAVGILTFDGSSTISGNIAFGSKSKNLFNSIKEILTEMNVKFGTTFSKQTYCIFTYKNNDLRKLNKLFEKNTNKWLRFKESYEEIDKGNFKLRYKKFAQSKISFDTLIQVLKQVKCCDINFLTKYFNCAHTSVAHYLNILKNNNKVRISSHPMNFNPQFVSPKTMVYLKNDFHNQIFNKIKEKFIEYQEFGKYMNIHKATLSNWKLKKSRIPLQIVKKICIVLNIDPSLISQNIEEADRRIVEII